MSPSGQPGKCSRLWSLVCPRCRATRVMILLVGVVLMSLGDLYMTLEHLTQSGMPEANPLAHAIIQYGSRTGLIVWKLATIVLAAGILFYARRRVSAELGALFCCGVMAWLTVRWLDYNTHVSEIVRDAHELVTDEQSQWVSLPSDP